MCFNVLSQWLGDETGLYQSVKEGEENGNAESFNEYMAQVFVCWLGMNIERA